MARSAKTMGLGIHHLAVVVRDLTRAEQFYSGLLGLPVLQRHADANGAPRAVWLSLGEGFLALERSVSDGPRRPDSAPGWHCVALGITAGERAAWRTKLEAAGHPVERESDYTIYVRDPDGNLVGLSHYPARVG